MTLHLVSQLEATRRKQLRLCRLVVLLPSTHTFLRVLSCNGTDIIPDGASVGWCTATSSKDKLVLGYVWPPEDYPWLSLYRSIVDGKIAARGLEFGTGGLHQPFEVLIKEGPILGRPNVHWLDAGKTRTFRYGCFLLPAADGTVGVSNVALSSSELVVKPIQAANASGALDPTRTLDTDVELTDGSAKYDCCRTRRSHVDAARPA